MLLNVRAVKMRFDLRMMVITILLVRRVLLLIALHTGIQIVIVRSSASILSLSVNECFERVSVGKRLSSSDVNRSVSVRSLKQCDVECEREMCNAYAFGIGPRGNGTCDISVQLPRSPPNEDPDFDLFVKVLQCRSMTMCFKRLVNGRRLIDRYIRRTFPCDSLSRCQLACSIEREFICEGFNYRFATNSELANSCQLTAMPGSHLDLTLDFTSDYDYDFYERDRNAPPICGHLSYKTWNYGLYPPPPQHTITTTLTRPSPGSPVVDFTHSTANTLWQRQPSHHHNTVWTPAEDYIYTVKALPSIGEGTSMPKVKWNNNGYECFVRARTGFRLDRRLIVLTLYTPTLYDCEVVCANEKKFFCNLISYRYSTLPSTDNCQLGEKTIRQLDPYFDLIPDRDYDIYIRNEYSKADCQPKRTWDSDCFERIRSGLTLEKSTIKFSLNTNSLMDCELICLHVTHFTCRAFSFRYGSAATVSQYNADNCLLTDMPVPEMDPRKHFVPDTGCELYHRASYGHGCELDQWPYNSNPPTTPFTPPPAAASYTPRPNSWPITTPFPPHKKRPPSVLTTIGGGGSSFYPKDDGRPSDKPAVTTGGYVPSTTTIASSEEDASEYSNDGFSTSNGTSPPRPSTYYPPQENPLLLIPALAFRPFVSTKSFASPSFGGRLPVPPTYSSPRGQGGGEKPYPTLASVSPTSSFGYDTKPIYPRKNDRLCYVTYGTPARLLSKAIRSSLLVVSEQECKAECSKAREHSHFRCVTFSYWSGHCELSDIELRDLRPTIDFSQDDTYWLFSWDFTDSRCYLPPSGSAPLPGSAYYPDAIWGSFTVSGQKCRQGTVCTHSPEAGIWSCPVDNGDWDYCCRQGHHCGYSEGYGYPWCYVGSVSREQWRPCNDFYYPYERNSNRAQHWPISYLHRHGPPNITSIAVNYQPSVVDSFLQSLNFNNPSGQLSDPRLERLNNNDNSTTKKTVFLSESNRIYNNNNNNGSRRENANESDGRRSGSSDLIEFQVIDVTENQELPPIQPNAKQSESIMLWGSNGGKQEPGNNGGNDDVYNNRFKTTVRNNDIDDNNSNNNNNNNNNDRNNNNNDNNNGNGNRIKSNVVSNSYSLTDGLQNNNIKHPSPDAGGSSNTMQQPFYSKQQNEPVRLRQIFTNIT